MNEAQEKITLPENLHNEILKFLLRTSLPRIQKEREQAKEKEQSPTEKNR